VTTVAQAWRAGRAARPRRARSAPALLVLVSWLATKTPAWKSARTAVMQWSAFAAIDTGLFGWHWIAGTVGVGVSLLVLEALGGERA
jgi:hypothetical protein